MTEPLDKKAPIAVMGSGGMVGAAVLRALTAAGWSQIQPVGRAEADLTSQASTYDWYAANRPRYVIVAAAKVGGIHANSTYPAEFIHDNLAIATNTIDGAWRHGVERLLFLGSSCIYPRNAPQPMTEDALLTGVLEPTNEAYAIAKIAGLKMCDAYARQYGCRFISAMPTNLYGIGDNFHPENSHVIPGLMRRFHDAVAAGDREVACWGTGSPFREFLDVDDLADALVFLLERYPGPGHINVGTGEEISIRALTELIAEVTGFTGRITWDATRPDGTPRKLMDVSRLHAMGWHHRTDLAAGLAKMYDWFEQHYQEARR